MDQHEVTGQDARATRSPQDCCCKRGHYTTVQNDGLASVQLRSKALDAVHLQLILLQERVILCYFLLLVVEQHHLRFNVI